MTHAGHGRPNTRRSDGGDRCGPLLDELQSNPQLPRVIDYLLGGRDSYGNDRQLAQQLLAVSPHLRSTALANIRHRTAAVTTLTRDLGIVQLLVLGCGQPTQFGPHSEELPLPHEVAARFQSSVRTVYVDIDPIVRAHVNAYLPANSRTVLGDISDMDSVLDHPTLHEHLDLRQPLGVLCHGTLASLDDDATRHTMKRLRDQLPTGSAISITHPTADMDSSMNEVSRLLADAQITYRTRTIDQICTLLGDLPAHAPGIVPTALWETAGISPSGMLPSQGYAVLLLNL
ncbi:SAM-dependent methyltransferase [Streptomyces sp. NPDC020883]|uniref:SAM-dependent methyltransferase n=1 Tax=Streptomyces sp. NPDC020883 TaxID=3365099 RepID=UPI003791FFF7